MDTPHSFRLMILFICFIVSATFRFRYTKPPSTNPRICLKASIFLYHQLYEVPSYFHRVLEDNKHNKDVNRISHFKLSPRALSFLSGKSVLETSRDLRAIGYHSSSFMNATADGEIEYFIPKNYASLIRNNHWLNSYWYVYKEKVRPVIQLAFRSFFGLFLLSSISLAAFAVLLIGSTRPSSLSHTETQRRPRSREEQEEKKTRSGHPRSIRPPTQHSPQYTIYLSDSTVFRIVRDLMNLVAYGNHRRGLSSSVSPDATLGFLESSFNFLFGEPDPNEEMDMNRKKFALRYIRDARHGVAYPQDLVLLSPEPPPIPMELSPEEDLTSQAAHRADMSFFLPLLCEFNGHPVALKDGNIAYLFPDLMKERQAERFSMLQELSFFGDMTRAELERWAAAGDDSSDSNDSLSSMSPGIRKPRGLVIDQKVLHDSLLERMIPFTSPRVSELMKAGLSFLILLNLWLVRLLDRLLRGISPSNPLTEWRTKSPGSLADPALLARVAFKSLPLLNTYAFFLVLYPTARAVSVWIQNRRLRSRIARRRNWFAYRHANLGD